MYIHELKNKPEPIVEKESLELLPRKALIHHELKSNSNGLVMIVHKSIKEIPEKFNELAEQNCRQKYNMQGFQCQIKCYEPIGLEKLSSYIIIIGTQMGGVDVFNEKKTLTIPMKNTILYSNKKTIYFGQDVVLSEQDISVTSLNDFEHDLLKKIRKNNYDMNNDLVKNKIVLNNDAGFNEHIKIMNQSNICEYFNQRPEERKIYNALKLKSAEFEINNFYKN